MLSTEELQLPHEDFEFSRCRLMQIEGHDASEHEYIFQYRDACIEAIEAGSATLAAIADGRRAFDSHLQSLTNSQVVRIRFHLHALDEAAQHFRHLPGLEKLFRTAFRQTTAIVNQAYEDHWQVSHLYDSSVRAVTSPARRKTYGGQQ